MLTFYTFSFSICLYFHCPVSLLCTSYVVRTRWMISMQLMKQNIHMMFWQRKLSSVESAELICQLKPTSPKLESYGNWVISQWPINNGGIVVGMSMTIVLCVVLVRSPHRSLSHHTISFFPSFFLQFSVCVSLTPSFSLIFPLSLLDECVLLGRADSSYLAEALWTIKIWFQSPAGCWAWGLGSQL